MGDDAKRSFELGKVLVVLPEHERSGAVVLECQRDFAGVAGWGDGT
jgi:hypothetical protein